MPGYAAQKKCTIIFRNPTLVVQFAYFCIGPNKRREQLKVFLVFLSNFRYKKQLLTFFERLFGNFLRN